MNYPGLRTLYDRYHADGFTLAAFPCNQFGGQAPGSDEEERAWAHRKFGFDFDVYVSYLSIIAIYLVYVVRVYYNVQECACM